MPIIRNMTYKKINFTYINQKYTILVLSILLCLNSFGQQNIDLEIDSLKIQLEKSKAPSDKINLLFSISRNYLDIDIDSATVYRKKIESRSVKFNKNLMLRLELLKIREFVYDYQLPLAQKSILNFKEKYLRTCALENKLEFLYLEGLFMFSANKVNEGIHFMQSTLKKYENLQTNIIADFHVLLSSFFVNKLEHLKSLDQLSKASYIYSKKNNQIGIYQVNYNIAFTYNNLKKYDKALTYIQNVISDKKIKKNRYQIIQENFLFGLILYKQGNYKKAIEVFDFVKNENAFLKLLDIESNTFYYKNLCLHNLDLPKVVIKNCKKEMNKYEAESERFSIYYLLIISYNKLNKFNDAKLFSSKLQHLIKTNTEGYLNADDKLDCLKAFMETEKGLNNFQEALQLSEQFYELYSSHNDSINIAKVSESLSSIEIKQKEIQVKDLTIAAQKNKAIIVRKENQNNYLKVIIVFGLIFVLLIYVFYRKIQNKNSKLKKQNDVISNSNAIILQTLKEKETLLKEIHHRVKNNLQLVVSILNIQASDKENTSIEGFIEKGQSRIASMVLIHENLYQKEDIGKIDFETYTESLVNNIRTTFGEISDRITVHINIKNVYLNIQNSIPLGLIINELITNSFKHGFPNKKTGQIIISIELLSNSNYKLSIKDSGIGFPKHKVDKKSIGMELVSLLVLQLKGKLTIESKNGTAFEIIFAIT